MADLAVPLAGSSAADTYLAGDRLIAAARALGRGRDPSRVRVPRRERRLRPGRDGRRDHLGRSVAESIRLMGSKVAAKQAAAAAGVPLPPSREVDGEDASVWAAAAETVGFPLLVKASAGGGGKGMRLVAGADALAEAVRAARREAASAFGDPTVFLERYLAGARHVEVQVFGDAHGNVIHLGERECSIQRRHQKVIEETPSPGITPETRERMLAAAVALARSVAYVGARDGRVPRGSERGRPGGALPGDEHAPAGRAPGHRGGHRPRPGGPAAARRRGAPARAHPGGGERRRPCRRGAGLRRGPRCGTPAVHRRARPLGRGPGGPLGLRGRGRDEVSALYDPMLAKVVAHGRDRDEAVAVLARALRGSAIHGVTTNLASSDRRPGVDGLRRRRHPHRLPRPASRPARSRGARARAALPPGRSRAARGAAASGARPRF